eukprot:m51a1_g11182 putative guanine nucleotide-binding 1 (564) ;mRNA; r:2486-4672
MGKPFSGKAKKEQLKAKRDRKRDGGGRKMNPTLWEGDGGLVARTPVERAREAAARKIAAAEPLRLAHGERRSPVPSEPLDAPPLAIFTRPPWSYDTPPKELEEREQREFERWMSELMAKHGGQLNYFESNIETWRQLWRVVERSDVVLHVVDARHALFHYSSALHAYVRSMGKPLVAVMNKADLVDAATADAWDAYLRSVCGVDDVVRFASSKMFVESDDAEAEAAGERPRERGGRANPTSAAKRYAAAADFRDRLLQTVRDVARRRYGEGLERLPSKSPPPGTAPAAAAAPQRHEEGSSAEGKVHSIVVGTVGNPNVGKSSLINALVKRKVVSVSRTPGHTKHFQTIRLADDVVLCDCPGMVLPALDRPRHLQVVCGLYPLAHLRDPFATLRYVAERFPLERVYGLGEKPADEDEWSPWAIAESLAEKRGYHTGKAGRADAHRAAREILADVVSGRVALFWGPPTAGAAARSKAELQLEKERLERAMQSAQAEAQAADQEEAAAGEEEAEGERAGDEEERESDGDGDERSAGAEGEDEDDDDEDGDQEGVSENPFDHLDDSS